MPVRPEMQTLIDYIRQQGSAAPDDAFNGVTYWTDQQLQDILDNNSNWITGRVYPVNHAKTIWTYNLPRHYYPDTATLTYLDENLDEVSVTPTYTLILGEIAMSEEPDAISGRFVNMWNALADLWGQKAAQRAPFVDNKSGQNALKLEQEYHHCVARQIYYRNLTIKRWRR